MDVCLASNPSNPNPTPDPNPIPNPNLFHDSDITRHSNVRQAMAEDNVVLKQLVKEQTSELRRMDAAL